MSGMRRWKGPWKGRCPHGDLPREADEAGPLQRVLPLLTPLEQNVPILVVRPASSRLSTKARIFIEQVKKTFALCCQFNPLSI